MATVAASTEQRKVTMRHVFEELNKKNTAVFDEIYSPNLVFHQAMGTEVKGLEPFKRIWQGVFKAFPDARFTLDDILIEGDKAAFRFTMTGTFKNEMLIQGKIVKPNGKEIRNTQFVFTRLEGGKVVEVWVMQNLLGLYQQMGVPLEVK